MSLIRSYSGGYPIGDLVFRLRAFAAANKDDLTSLDLRYRRQYFMDMGVPAVVIPCVSHILITSLLEDEQRGIPSDYSLGINIPSILTR